MADELIDVPLTYRQCVFINERLEMLRRRKEKKRLAKKSSYTLTRHIDPIISIETPSNRDIIARLSLRQIFFINDQLAKDRADREKERKKKHPLNPRGPTLKDPLLEIHIQVGTGIATIIQTSPSSNTSHRRHIRLEIIPTTITI